MGGWVGGKEVGSRDSHSWLLKIRKRYSGCKAHDVFCSCVCVLSRFSRVELFATLWTAARQAPLSMGTLQARILEWVAMPSSRGSS